MYLSSGRAETLVTFESKSIETSSVLPSRLY
jgi:hypothetical protein